MAHPRTLTASPATAAHHRPFATLLVLVVLFCLVSSSCATWGNLANLTAQDASVNIANLPLAGGAAILRIDSFLRILIRGLILLLALIVNVYAQRPRASSAT